MGKPPSAGFPLVTDHVTVGEGFQSIASVMSD